MQNKGHYAVQGHSRSLILVPINSPHGVINTNLHPILHCFQVIADYWSNFHIQRGVHTVQGEPLNSGQWNLASRN